MILPIKTQCIHVMTATSKGPHEADRQDMSDLLFTNKASNTAMNAIQQTRTQGLLRLLIVFTTKNLLVKIL